MPVSPDTRDGRISKEILSAQEVVDRLRPTMGSLIADAHSQDAFGHERMYEAVQDAVEDAFKALGLAFDIMAYGESSDYE